MKEMLDPGRAGGNGLARETKESEQNLREKMAGRRESIAEGNKDYSYLAGPTSTPINRGACSTRQIYNFLLLAHTLTHTLGE